MLPPLPPATLQRVLQAAEKVTHKTIAEFESKDRHQPLVNARFAIALVCEELARKQPNTLDEQLSDCLHRCRNAVAYSRMAAKKFIKVDREFQWLVSEIRKASGV
jgi:hypothetical protein